LTVRLSQLNGCQFCTDLNSATLLKRGASQDKVLALQTRRSSNLFGELERAALDYAEAMTLSDQRVTDEQVAALRRHSDDDGFVQLTAL
jgi:AhpD family alkylhydroperoxidase